MPDDDQKLAQRFTTPRYAALGAGILWVVWTVMWTGLFLLIAPQPERSRIVVLVEAILRGALIGFIPALMSYYFTVKRGRS